jgi:hypothetical protein
MKTNNLVAIASQRLKRISLSVIAVLLLLLLVSASSRAPQSLAGVTAQTLTNQPTKSAKAKKVLVKELPKELRGIKLEDGVFKIQPGYRIVTLPGNKVTVVALDSSSTTGKFGCACNSKAGTPNPTGTCHLEKSTSTLNCVKSEPNACSDTCFLEVEINKANTWLRLAAY